MFYLSDIDECIVSPPCGDNANCNNTEGSYECECKTGFSGDGLNCSGIYILEKHHLWCSVLIHYNPKSPTYTKKF